MQIAADEKIYYVPDGLLHKVRGVVAEGGGLGAVPGEHGAVRGVGGQQRHVRWVTTLLDTNYGECS